MSKDPLWEKIKSQTKPLPNREDKTSPNQQYFEKTAKDEPRPILDADFIKHQTQGPVISKGSSERVDASKRIRRGRVEIDSTVDLHGFSEQKAREKLLNHLIDARACKTVLVITGKGERGAGVLRNALPVWLKSPEFSSMVYGFAQAHRRHGGAGAWYLFLRRRQ